MNRRNQYLFRLVLPLLLLPLLAACQRGRATYMRQQLAHLQALNQADSLLTDDSLAQALALYFDDHGTPNEQMEAHYLLGRTYADRGEAPAAIAAYHDAIDRADTTAADCDYRQLCRVYSQMADVYFKQNLSSDNLISLDYSIAAAEKAGDTMAAFNSYAMKMVAFDRLGMHDSVMATYDNVYKMFRSVGKEKYASTFSVIAAASYLETGKYAQAGKALETYEKESGFFDASGKLESGHEIYYYYKGRYCLATAQYDSAYYYFQKELQEGKNFNNQNAASRGLALLYQQINKPDSAAKYALYSYAMNDSVYAQMATQDVTRISKMYDYSRHQRNSLEEMKRANTEHSKFVYTLAALTVIIIMAFYILTVWRQKQKALSEKYDLLLGLLTKTRNEKDILRLQVEKVKEQLMKGKDELNTQLELTKTLQHQEEELEKLVQTKEEEIAKLSLELKPFTTKAFVRKGFTPEQAESELYQMTIQLSRQKSILTDDQMSKLYSLISEQLPGFCYFIEQNKEKFDVTQYRMCLLLRLNLRTKEVANLLGVNISYISQESTDLVDKLWNIKGSSKVLKGRLLDIS